MTASATRQNEHIIMYVASRKTLRTETFNFTRDVKPVLEDFGVRPITRAMQNLREAGMIGRVSPGEHCLTDVGLAALIPLGDKPSLTNWALHRFPGGEQLLVLSP